MRQQKRVSWPDSAPAARRFADKPFNRGFDAEIVHFHHKSQGIAVRAAVEAMEELLIVVDVKLPNGIVVKWTKSSVD